MDSALLHKYFSCETSEEEEKAILSWVAASATNRSFFNDERKLWNALTLHGSALNAENEQFKRQKAPIISMKRWMQAAAVLLTIIGGTWLYRHNNFAEQSSPIITVSVPSGKRQKVVLPDSSIVWLNAKTTLKYPQYFNNSTREVALDGEAYFEVTHSDKHPFVVTTGVYSVNVFGTKFNVDAYHHKLKVETVLISGSVGIKQGNKPIVILKPKEKFVWDCVNKQAKINAVETETYLSWLDGLYQFTETPFAEMLETLNNYYPEYHIVLNDSSLKQYQFTGRFRQEEKEQDVLEVAQALIPFRYEIDSTKKLITIFKKHH